MLFVVLISPASTQLSDYLDSATANVVLPCTAARNHTLADTPALAVAPPTCSWRDYEAFLTHEGLDWTDVPMMVRFVGRLAAAALAARWFMEGR